MVGSFNNTDIVLLFDMNDKTHLNYYIDSQFMIFWCLLRLNKVFLINSDDGDPVDYLLIVNAIYSGGYLYFVKVSSS